MSKTVLIIDDAYFMRNLLKKALKEAGYEVIGEAKNGKEGIKFYFELKPDIVTMDITMPDMSGIETTKQILSKDPHAKIIAVTGNNKDEIKREILEAGAKEYLQKPFQPAFLLNKLEKMLEEPEVVLLEDEKVISEEKEIETSTSIVVQQTVGIEDDFDTFDDLEIEIMDKPDESKNMTFVIENGEDSIEFPEEYTEEVNEQQKEFSLTKEKVEEDDILIELNLDDNQTLIDLEEDVQPTTVIKEPISRRPVIEPSAPKTPVPPRKPESKQMSIMTSRPTQKQENATPPLSNQVQKETLVSTVEITKSKKPDRKMEEISIRPQGLHHSSGKEVNIRPPRGRILREDKDNYDETEIEEPILNVSDKDNYNNDKNNSLFGMVKKLFKK